MSWSISAYLLYTSDSTMGEDEMLVDDELLEIVLNRDLEQQIFNALDPRFLLQLVCNLLMLLLHLVYGQVNNTFLL